MVQAVDEITLVLTIQAAWDNWLASTQSKMSASLTPHGDDTAISYHQVLTTP
jgi:hypothetical protein